MKGPTQKPGRRSIRLRAYDYAQSGAYLVTICAHQRRCLFGEIANGEMQLSPYGEIVREEWFRSAEIRREIELYPEEFVVMPNHIHGIIWIVEYGGPNDSQERVGATGRSPRGPPPRSLASFIAGFKSAATRRINALRGTPGAPVWQRNYYEHIIRDELALHHIRDYIATNPARWATDRENPNRQGPDPLDRWLAAQGRLPIRNPLLPSARQYLSSHPGGGER